MSWSLGTPTYNTSTLVSSISAASASTVALNDIVFLAIQSEVASDTFTISGGGGSFGAAIKSAVVNGITFSLYARIATSGDTGKPTYTVTSTGSTDMAMMVWKASGNAIASYVDQSNNNSAATVSPPYTITTDSITTATANDLVIALYAWDGYTANASQTAPIGYTALLASPTFNNDGTNVPSNFVGFYKTLTGTSTENPSFTWSASETDFVDLAALIVAIKPTTGTTFTVTATDAATTVQDAVSVSQTSNPQTPADRAMTMSDSVAVTVTHQTPPPPPTPNPGTGPAEQGYTPSFSPTTFQAPQRSGAVTGAIEIDLPAGGDFALDPTGDLILAVDTYGFPVATTERIIRLIMTNPRIVDPSGNAISTPEDPFNPTYGAGARAMVGQPLTNGFVSSLQARITAALASDPSVASVPPNGVTVAQTGAYQATVAITVIAVSGQTITIPSLPLSIAA